MTSLICKFMVGHRINFISRQEIISSKTQLVIIKLSIGQHLLRVLYSFHGIVKNTAELKSDSPIT